jgi:hypothetical protein
MSMSKTPSVIWDADALLFIANASITDNTQKSAINTLATDLKTYGIWTKMIALYPMVGGTATTHKFNLKDPRDLDVAYRLVFVNGWTHSSTGAKPNGIDAYADSKLNSATVIPVANHLSYYSRTNVSEVKVEMGAFDVTPVKPLSIGVARDYVSGGFASLVYFSSTSDSRGFWLGTRRSSSDREVYKNGSSESTFTTLELTENPNKTLYIGARNENAGANYFSSKECAFASIGNGLTDTEVSNFYIAVNKFQTTLSRNV